VWNAHINCKPHARILFRNDIYPLHPDQRRECVCLTPSRYWRKVRFYMFMRYHIPCLSKRDHRRLRFRTMIDTRYLRCFILPTLQHRERIQPLNTELYQPFLMIAVFRRISKSTSYRVMYARHTKPQHSITHNEHNVIFCPQKTIRSHLCFCQRSLHTVSIHPQILRHQLT
jgi:hypothetical protein